MREPDIRQADRWLTLLRALPPQDWQLQRVTELLQRAVEAALGLPPMPTQELRALLVESVRAQDPAAQTLTREQILHRVQRYDCHQIPRVLQRKVALLLYIERFLQLPLPDEEAAGIRTVGQLAQCLIEHRITKD